MTAVEADPALIVKVDVANLALSAGTLRVRATMPTSAHDALVSGLWDGTGLLLDDFDQVRQRAASLPYVSGAW